MVNTFCINNIYIRTDKITRLYGNNEEKKILDALKKTLKQMDARECRNKDI